MNLHEFLKPLGGEITIDIQGMTKLQPLKEDVMNSLVRNMPFMLESKHGGVLLFLPGKRHVINLSNGYADILVCETVNQWQSAISQSMLSHRKFIPANLIESKIKQCLNIQNEDQKQIGEAPSER